MSDARAGWPSVTAVSNWLSNRVKPACRALRNRLQSLEKGQAVIKSIKHKGLRKFYETGTTKGVRSDHVSRLRQRLAVLDAATSLDDVAIHSWGLHQLNGDKADQWAIRVSGNWRLFFEFVDGDVYLLDYDDYH